MGQAYLAAAEGFRSGAEVNTRLLRYIIGSVPTGSIPVGRTVLAVPPSFSFDQHNALLRAAGLAGVGLAEVDLVEEPTAAVADYFNTHGDLLGEPGTMQHIVVFDLGDGCSPAASRPATEGRSCRERLDAPGAGDGAATGDPRGPALAEYLHTQDCPPQERTISRVQRGT